MDGSYLFLNELIKKYGEKVAVAGIDLSVGEGEFTVLVGPSGCGKTTTLRMIAGLEQITSGEIYIRGNPIGALPPRKRDVAMVFQNYSLYPHMKVWDNLAFGLKVRGTSKAEIRTKVEEIATMLHILELLDRRPAQMSGGERQRVAIGRALVRNPKIYLLDEPLSNLDAKLRLEMRSEIKRIHQKFKTTTIYVTHDQAEAMSMADRLVVMKDGKIMQQGKPIDVYHQPQHMFVAQFMGSPAMNLLQGTIRMEDQNLHFMNESFSLPLPPSLTQALYSGNFDLTDEFFLGVRPENFHPISGNNTNGIRTDGDILTVEPMGAETQVLVSIGNHEIRARMNGNILINPGQSIALSFDPNHVHMFHGPSGKAIITDKVLYAV